MKTKTALSLVALWSCTACTTTDLAGNKTSLFDPNLNSGVAIAMNMVEKFVPDSRIQTAKSSDILFTQKAKINHAVKIDREFNSTSMPLFGVKFSVTPDDILYPALTLKYGTIYCTLGKSGRELFGSSHRTCFRDSDKDNAFDELWMTDEQGGVHEGYATVWASYSPTNKIEMPISYEKMDAADLPIDTFGVRYKYFKSIFGKESLTFSTVNINDTGEAKDVNATMSDVRTIQPNKVSFPVTITLGSAKIEIVSFEDKMITYRILDAYKEGVPVMLGRKRKPQVTYVYVPG